MKRMLIKAVLAVCIILTVCVISVCVREHFERRQCVCEMLSDEEQTFPIDDRLYRVCEKDMMNSGVFMLVRTGCDHGKYFQLTIIPDEGKFKGYILKN